MRGFDRSGLGAQSDLASPEWKELYGLLEVEQYKFLERESEFRGEDYKWPSDALHNWSRVWEYPYVYYHLRSLLAKSPRARTIVDLGSGITFFPFALAKLGFNVTCCDIDPVCKPAIARASKIMPVAPGSVEFKLIESSTLPLEAETNDALYCLSVLEHIPNFEVTIKEVARALKPGAQFLLTCDLDLRGDLELGQQRFYQLLDLLGEDFEWALPERTIHPRDILNSYTGLFPFANPRGAGRVLETLKQKVAKPLLGIKPGFVDKAHLAVYSAVLTRKY